MRGFFKMWSVDDRASKPLGFQARVQLRRATVPGRVQIVIKRSAIAAVDEAQELVHRAHDGRVRVERAAGKADVGWTIFTKPLHQCTAPANDSDREAAANGFAVSHHVGTNA